MKFLNALIASGIAIQEVFASVKPDALTIQKNTQLLTVHARETPKTLNACCVKVTTQPTTKTVCSIKISKKVFPCVTRKIDNTQITITRYICKHTN